MTGLFADLAVADNHKLLVAFRPAGTAGRREAGRLLGDRESEPPSTTRDGPTPIGEENQD